MTVIKTTGNSNSLDQKFSNCERPEAKILWCMRVFNRKLIILVWPIEFGQQWEQQLL